MPCAKPGSMTSAARPRTCSRSLRPADKQAGTRDAACRVARSADRASKPVAVRYAVR
jgi:hypothetical protein